LDFGVGLAPTEPIGKIVRLAKTAEELGFKYFVHADQRLHGERDAFVTLTADALNTSKVNIGTCISDPFSRIPAMLASAIASLDEVSDHRAILTMGSGGAGFKELNIERKHPNKALKEAITIIRSLIRGEEVNFDGDIFHVSRAKLDYECRHDIPIQVASRSPMNLELAGQIADGVLLASYATPGHIKFALSRVKAGAEKRNRRLQDIRKIAWLYTSVSDDPQKALNNVRPFVTQALVNTSAAMYPIMFEGFDTGLRQFVETCKETHDLQKAYDDRRYITDEVVENFSLAGTVDQVVEKLKWIEKLGIDAVWIRPFSAPFSEVNHEQVVVPFGEKVIPRMSS
jgi:5,10-methylenetetrahydromethanopterin reductase